MIYKLILITLLSVDTHKTMDAGTFDDLMSCFDARDLLLVEAKAWEGHFPKGQQAVCVPFDLTK